VKKFIYLTIALIICFATAGIAQASPYVILDESELTFDCTFFDSLASRGVLLLKRIFMPFKNDVMHAREG